MWWVTPVPYKQEIFFRDQQGFSAAPGAGTDRGYNAHVYRDLRLNAHNVHYWKAAQTQEEMKLQDKAFLEVVHTKFERGRTSKFCGIITRVESFNLVLCSQNLTRHAISTSIYITRIIHFLGLECLSIFKESPCSLTNSKGKSAKS